MIRTDRELIGDLAATLREYVVKTDDIIEAMIARQNTLRDDIGALKIRLDRLEHQFAPQDDEG